MRSITLQLVKRDLKGFRFRDIVRTRQAKVPAEDIISLSSGRLRDCVPKDDFDQSRERQSNADRLQLKLATF
ncbi:MULTISPECIES: hypothetical protein [unclassified Bradyrhizobium]|uniref:hypothetical protein n=1 Tax=unclassified Bradyrhizobium TaxID=2631580 RepID=UPI002478A197|nr:MULTISPECIES: hypothetical protein [unclassified Bradyrhizobium]WGR72964.1 hypothetical protein MTX24_08795 [Bradyrhizobium sp. ISRA426]WGR77799.1 hypothetical protein MTX21_33750 [Bradyrhizobium sp. ISRA430]WGR88204.1 hypothetical protein MTX25_08800 [Bradyrhizobium sp. ISRA432]